MQGNLSTKFCGGGDLFPFGSLDGWVPVGPAAAVPSLPSAGRLGGSAAELGSDQPASGDSSIWQTFTTPASGANWLSFWYKNTWPDSVTFDWATATLTDTASGATTTPLPKTGTAKGDWTLVTTKVTLGHTYTLTPTNHDDAPAQDPTFTFLDDVNLTRFQPANRLSLERDPLNMPSD